MHPLQFVRKFVRPVQMRILSSFTFEVNDKHNNGGGYKRKLDFTRIYKKFMELNIKKNNNICGRLNFSIRLRFELGLGPTNNAIFI